MAFIRIRGQTAHFARAALPEREGVRQARPKNRVRVMLQAAVRSTVAPRVIYLCPHPAVVTQCSSRAYVAILIEVILPRHLDTQMDKKSRSKVKHMNPIAAAAQDRLDSTVSIVGQGNIDALTSFVSNTLKRLVSGVLAR